MPEIQLEIMHEVGLHARPAALFVQTAKKYQSDIMVKNGEREVNAKSILSVLTLGADQGSKITVSAEGVDAEQALDAIKDLVESNFSE